MKDQEEHIPETLMECFRIIEQEVSRHDLANFKNTAVALRSPMDHNFGWGLYLRNRFLHPPHSPIRRKFEELGYMLIPDMVSESMKELFWRYLNDQPLDEATVQSLFDKSLIVKPRYEKNAEGKLQPLEREPIDVAKVKDLLGN